ncbi:MAG: serine/threonine protein kinase [Myxococcales bacterium]|nr:serine/threonine protein kinase [Myxococcales bacterium]
MSASVLAPGVVVADTYEVERQLGQGGMGEVWLARHRRLAGKQVAIKVLRTQGQLPPDTLARFRHEAEIAARLEHPNIVQVLDFNALPSGEPFLVMELLKGTSLAQRLKGGPLPWDQVVAVVRQVGAALSAAHAAGVVHRDLKPENIFLVPTGVGDQVKVLDFGISKLADSKTVQTTDSVLIGTPLYMSPEQALGNNRDVTAQSDVFSLAGIAYEMLTGQPPFLADSVAKVVFRIAYEKHRPLGEARADLPAPVAQAVEHALVKDKAQRTKDMAAFVHELTGQPLAPPRTDAADESSGVYTPDRPVSDSMAGGATISRGSNERATPAPPQPSPPPAPQATSRVPALVGLLSLVLALSAVVGWTLLRPAADSAADAGVFPALPSVDAGAVTAASPEKPDAAVEGASLSPDAALAAAPPVADAGARPVRATRSDPSGPLSDAEKASLAGLQQLVAQKDLGAVLARRPALRREFPSAAGYHRALLLVARAACLQHDDRVLTPAFIEELASTSSPATFTRLKKECLAAWPDAAARWD